MALKKSELYSSLWSSCDELRGVETRERKIKEAMYEILNDVDEVNRIFIIIKAQKEY
ncbi:MAG: hypothetical protein QM426_04890 [Euryarchaeota archaeon]|nr:hypothetical protein [Euryarchaeota archaeon]